MKKLLALVLAMVMTLGLATVSAGAAYKNPYTDKDSIDFTEAVEVMSKVGVFQGKGENFAPKDNLNRAEAAKLIAYLMLGNSTAESMKGNGNKFTDVPADHYASGYIEYLAAAGVVSGVGDRKFDPNGQVTAVQFAKMLCVALGYDAKAEGYVGESWNINIMKQANKDKILDLLSDLNTNDLITREQAAQMCLNALKATMVEYESKGDELNINGATLVLNAKKAQNKTTTDTKGRAIKSDVDRTNTIGTTLITPYIVQLGEELYKGDLKLDQTERDKLGRPSNKWIWKSEEIGTYANKSDLRETVNGELKRGSLYDILGKSVYDNLKEGKSLLYYFEDGKENVVANTDGLINNYGYDNKGQFTDQSNTNKPLVEYFIQKDGDKKINNGQSTGNGSVTEIFVDSDTDNVTIVVTNTYVFKAATDYRSSTEDLVLSTVSDAKNQSNIYDAWNQYKNNGSNNNFAYTPSIINLDSTRVELSDFPQITDIKKDDYLLVTVKKDGNVYKVDTLTKAEKLTGKVEKVVVKDSLVVDGETLKYSAKATDDTKGNEFSVGQETTVVLDKFGYVIAVDEAVVANNYVFISELYQPTGSTTKVRANAFFTDGTNQEIVIKEIASDSLKSSLVGNIEDNKGNKDTSNVAGLVMAQDYVGWYTYNKNSSGEYTLNALNSNYTQGAHYYAATTTKDDDNAAKFTLSDKVAFINQGTDAYADKSEGFKYVTTMSKSAAKANDKTIMVVTYGDKNDVDIYTGVKNMPDIRLTKDQADNTKDGKGIIFTAVKDGYAKYVFVSLQGDYSVFGSENENLLYVIKYDHKNTGTDNKSYYTYKALDENGKQVIIEAENALKSGNITYDGSNTAQTDVYGSFYKTSKNADGRYTRIDAVPNTGKYASIVKNSLAITADNGALSIGGKNFTLAKDYRLVVVSRADALNKLKGVDYEANFMTAEGLEAMVKGYTVSYTMQAKLDNNDSDKIVEAYVTIFSATAKRELKIDLSDAPAGLIASSDKGDVGLQNVYYVTKDTGTVTITLKNTSAGDVNVDASVSGNGYTATALSNQKINANGGTATISVNVPSNVASDGTLTVKTH